MLERLPNTGLVVLMGAPASGKSTFARVAFHPTDILSTDRMRALFGGDASNLSVTEQAHSVLCEAGERRLREGVFTVLDSTATDEPLVRRFRQAAEAHGQEVRYLLADATLEQCVERNRQRVKGRVPDDAIARLAMEVDRAVEVAKRSGAQVETLGSFFGDALRGKKIFVAAPVTEYMGQAAYRTDKHELCEASDAALLMAGAHVAGASINERYGKARLEAREYAEYDVTRILEADLLLAWSTSGLTPDTYLEIGTALGARKPVGVLLPSRAHQSGILRGLVGLRRVMTASFETDSGIPKALLRLASNIVAAQT